MSLAVRSFFGLDLAAAAEQLDEAWYAVREASPSDAIERFVTGHQLMVAPLVSESVEDELRVSLKPTYGQAGDEHDSLPVRIAAHDLEGMPQAEVEESFGQLREGLSWIPGKLSEGDLRVARIGLVAARVCGRTLLPSMPRCAHGRRPDCVTDAAQSPPARRHCEFPPLRATPT